MITKMTKYTFLLHSDTTAAFLGQIQELGLVDITRESKPVDARSKELSETLSQYTLYASKLKEVAKELKGRTPAPYTATAVDPLEAAQEVYLKAKELFSRRDALRSEVASLTEATSYALPWGAFTPQDKATIDSLGYVLHAYRHPTKKMDPAWEAAYPLQIISQTEHDTFFVVLETPPEEYTFPLREVPFPTQSALLLQPLLSQKQKDLEDCVSQLESLTGQTARLTEACTLLGNRLDLQLACAASQAQAEGRIDVLTGFIPTEQQEAFQHFLETQPVYYQSAAAQIEDNPPVKLKNNWFARLFEPIGAMYMPPQYNELDLTPYFAPFYMLFFGMCLGDMGYGLLIMLIGLVGKRFLPQLKSYLNLAFFLGLGSFLMASLAGSFFGAKVVDLVPKVADVQDFFFLFTDMKMFWFAILFGLFQIVFARVLTAIDSFTRKGWQHAMAPLGWAILIVWCTLAYAATMVEGLALPPIVSRIMLFLSLALILFFSKPEGPVHKRIGLGVWAMYDITGVFGDMLSYIRLFGLGTSGGILGMVINTLALSLSGIPVIGWLLTIVLLLFGHALVLGLSVLGAFVHPMRLTFVEFYKNAGFTGGGRLYNPLKINNK